MMKKSILLLSLFVFSLPSLQAQWQTLYFPLLPPYIPNLNSVCFKNYKTGMAAGDDSYIYPIIIRTFVAGLTWDTVYYLADTGSFSDIIIIDTMTVVAVGKLGMNQKGIIARSVDFGNSWDTLIVNNWLRAVDFPSKQTGYAVGHNGAVFKTTNSGQSWNPVNTPLPNHFNSVQFINDTIGLVAGDTIILRTINGGNSWSVDTINPYNFTSPYFPFIKYLNFPHDSIGYFLAEFGFDSIQIYKTFDYGTNWIHYSTFFQSPGGTASMYFYNDTVGYITGVFTIYKTIDGGLTWYLQGSSPPSYGAFWDWVSDVYFVSVDTGYAVGSGGYGHVYRTYNGGDTIVTVSIFPDENDASVTVYPNPFSDITTINIHTNMDLSNTLLNIYSLAGEKVISMNPEGFKITIERKDLPSGLYLYEISNGTTVKLKGKLIIID